MNFSEIYYEESRTDVLLIQPNVMMNDSDDLIINRFAKYNNMHGLIADSVIEHNWGLLYIADYLLRNNHSVQVVDFNYYDYCKRKKWKIKINDNDIKEILKLKNSPIIGISCMTVSIVSALKIARNCKELYPRSTIILGGIHVNYFWESLLRENEFIDIIVLGEGEIPFNNIVENKDRLNISGIAFRSNGKIIMNKAEKYDVNSYIRPAYELIPDDIKLIPRLYLSRGCYGECKYCSVSRFFDNICRFRNLDLVMDELVYLISNKDVTTYMIGDLSFGIDRNVALRFCKQIIQRKLNHIKWWCQMRICDVDEELLDMMYSAGCRQIGIGIESEHTTLLGELSANKHNKKIYDICDMITSRGIQIQGYFIIGLPHDTTETIMQNIKLIEELIKNEKITFPHISVTVPYPGTELYENPAVYDINIVEKNFSKYYMNCDAENSGLPVFNTKYLDRYQIYSLWKYALMTAIKHLKKVKTSYTLPGSDITHQVKKRVR